MIYRKSEAEEIKRLLQKAKRDLDCAWVQFNYAKQITHIDYSIVLIDAAEKRYDLLLNRLKELEHEKKL